MTKVRGRSGDIKNDHRKLRNYVLFKKSLRLEKYLSAHSSSRGRSYPSSLRNGTNILEVEKGRWEGLKREQRICKHCNLNVTEDERHFLLFCPKYNDYRTKLYKSMLDVSGGKWDMKNKPSEEVFILLLQGTRDEYEPINFRVFHCYLERCFRLRNNEGVG